MNYCPRCGAQLGSGQNFCGRCGLDVRERPTQEQLQAQPTTPVRGLGRNTVVYLTQDGLQGVRITSVALLFLAILGPPFFLTALYHEVQMGALVVYVAIWAVASALLYDELRWRGIRNLDTNQLGAAGVESWLVPWKSIRMADWNGRTLWFTSADPRRKLSVTFDKTDAPAVEKTLNSRGVMYSWRPPRFPPALTRFSTLALSLFIAGQVIMILAATLPFFPGEEQIYTTVVNHTRQQISGATFFGEFQDIFLNNIQVAWGGAIPFLGTVTYGIASYNTGRAIQVIAITSQPPVPPWAVLVELYLFPHTWVEESAYPIATVAGVLAFTKWRSVSPGEFPHKLNRGSAKLALALGGAAAILMAAGFLEVLATYLQLGALLLWAPLVVIYYLWARSRRRRRHSQSMGSP